MKIRVQKDACVGAGQCALVADTLFDQDDDGIVILVESQPSASESVAARRAAMLCPARAISIDE